MRLEASQKAEVYLQVLEKRNNSLTLIAGREGSLSAGSREEKQLEEDDPASKAKSICRF